MLVRVITSSVFCVLVTLWHVLCFEVTRVVVDTTRGFYSFFGPCKDVDAKWSGKVYSGLHVSYGCIVCYFTKLRGVNLENRNLTSRT